LLQIKKQKKVKIKAGVTIGVERCFAATCVLFTEHLQIFIVILHTKVKIPNSTYIHAKI